jgi:hypothetical protein
MNLKPCSVEWCVAMATHGDKCVIHAKFPTLKPEPPADDEQLIDGGIPCDECNGTGECSECDGTCYATCRCHCGDEHDTECETCVDDKGDSTGKCQECDGTGRICVRKLDAANA